MDEDRFRKKKYVPVSDLSTQKVHHLSESVSQPPTLLSPQIPSQSPTKLLKVSPISQEKLQNSLSYDLIKSQLKLSLKKSKDQILNQQIRYESEYDASSDEESEEDEPKPKKKQKIFLVEEYSDLIFSSIPPSCTLRCVLFFSEQMFSLNNTYQLFLLKERKKVLTGLRKKLQMKSSFELQSPSKEKIGKIRSNFTGTQYIAEAIEEEEKQLCWIGYNMNVFGGQRSIKVIRNSNKKLQHVPHFSKIKTYYQNGMAQKFDKFHTKKASNKNGQYQLDFHGKISLPSIRNFILCNDTQKQCLLFGKKGEGAYILEISHPFSIFEAFCIALTNLDRRILVR